MALKREKYEVGKEDDSSTDNILISKETARNQ